LTYELKTMATREEQIAAVLAITAHARWQVSDYDGMHIKDHPAFVGLSIGERWDIIREALLRKKQDAMHARQVTKRAKKTGSKANAKHKGDFKTRRLKNFPDYLINENGMVIGPTGTELKYRWDGGTPYVRVAGKDRKVYWLLVEAGFQESPEDKRERRAAAKADIPRDVNGSSIAELRKAYNDDREALAEDPELFGDPENPAESAL
jgi:hypothetical protein